MVIFFYSQPSHSMAGGVGFYIKDNCDFHIRNDFTDISDHFFLIIRKIKIKTTIHGVYRRNYCSLGKIISLKRSEPLTRRRYCLKIYNLFQKYMGHLQIFEINRHNYMFTAVFHISPLLPQSMLV